MLTFCIRVRRIVCCCCCIFSKLMIFKSAFRVLDNLGEGYMWVGVVLVGVVLVVFFLVFGYLGLNFFGGEFLIFVKRGF